MLRLQPPLPLTGDTALRQALNFCIAHLYSGVKSRLRIVPRVIVSACDSPTTTATTAPVPTTDMLCSWQIPTTNCFSDSLLSSPASHPSRVGVWVRAHAHVHVRGEEQVWEGGWGERGEVPRSNTKKEDQICISSLGKEHHDSLNTVLRTYLQKMCILCHSPEQNLSMSLHGLQS